MNIMEVKIGSCVQDKHGNLCIVIHVFVHTRVKIVRADKEFGYKIEDVFVNEVSLIAEGKV